MIISGRPGVRGRGIAINPAMIRIDPVTTLAAWTTLIIIGLAFGFSWHPKGLRLLRRCKVKWGRLFKKKSS